MTLTKKTQTDLQKAAYEIFLSPTYQKYINKMMAVIGKDGIKDILDGFSTIPKTFGKDGFEFRKWKNQGSFQTPGFKEVYQEGYHNESKNEMAMKLMNSACKV